MDAFAQIIGESPGVKAALEQVRHVISRQSDVRRLPPILIHGETGTGKGLLALAIHQAGPRAQGPFVDVSCAAIPETLLEAELFGFERGAFTGARQAKAGLLQAAHRGTIFLDDIGLLPPTMQGKLLKALEDRTVRRLGSTHSEPVDVWIIVATNEDLRTAARTGRFREDLYHRLAVLTLSLPPLRERGEDVLLLAEHFLHRACQDYGLLPKTLSPEARAALVTYSWPGNVREVANLAERVALLSDAPVVSADMLELEERSGAAGPSEQAPEPRAEEPGALRDAMASAERAHLVDALREARGNIARAAARLGIPRNTLRYRMEKLGLGRDAPVLRRQAGRPRLPSLERPAAAAPSVASREQRRLTLLRVERARSPVSLSTESDPVLGVCTEKIQSFGGRVLEVGVTGLVGAFGFEPVEDAPARAALTALAILNALRHLRRQQAELEMVRLAIHTSHCLVARADGAVELELGAKRSAWTVLDALIARAEPETVTASEAAAPSLERRFELTPLDATTGGERMYRLARRERAEIGRRPTPFVGRRQELELLVKKFERARQGRGQVVGIVGESGIGKSRLLHELRQRVRAAPLTYLEAECTSYGSTIPYLPVRALVRHHCRIVETDDPGAIAEKVRAALDTFRIPAREAAPYLLQLLGVQDGAESLGHLTPQAVQARTLDVLCQFWLRSSRRQPVVLVVESLHWADSSSEACFASLVQSVPGEPIIFLATYRPGYRPTWIDMSYASQIALEPLDPLDSRHLLQALLGADVAEPLARLLVERAGGNPFFLEELAHVVEGHGSGASPALTVPDTVEAVILARIARLSKEAKRVLQAASVLGREVSPRVLHAIWKGPEPLDVQLRELARLEFLSERRGGDEPLHVIKHALTQEVAYQSLPAAEREALHAAVGETLEAHYAGRLGEVYDQLAYHYARTDRTDKAVTYLTRFARQATRSHAHEAAIHALAELLRHAERLPDESRPRVRLEAILRQARSLLNLGRNEEGLDLLVQNRECLEQLRDPVLAASYYFHLGFACLLVGDQQEGARHARRALAEADASGDDATVGKAYALLTLASFFSDAPVQGLEYGRQAVAALERAGAREQQPWLGHANIFLAFNHEKLGEIQPALEAAARAGEVGEAIGDPRLRSSAAWEAGALRALAGDWDAGIEACRRGLELAPDPFSRAQALGHLGYAFLEKGDAAQAMASLSEAVTQLREFRWYRGWIMAWLSEACFLGGQAERARALATETLELARANRYRFGEAWARRTLGRVAQARGCFAEAEQHLGEALRIFEAIPARLQAGRTLLTLAEVARSRGDRVSALARLSGARQLFSALGLPRYVEQAVRFASELEPTR